MVYKFCVMLFIVSVIKAQVFDIHLITSPLKAAVGQEKACKKLGYDGLAIVNTPEKFSYAVKIARRKCLSKNFGTYVGLRYNTRLNDVVWEDGTPLASDIPKYEHFQIHSDYSSGRITNSKTLRMGTGLLDQCALCGSHTHQFQHAKGVSESGKQPDGVSSILSASEVQSYLQCVDLCGRDILCRAAEFSFDLLTCRTFGPGNYTSLVSNDQTKTFVRVGF